MRRPRLHVPGACYHVTLRGNHQQDIFFSPGDRLLLGSYVAAAREQVDARIHAYCWMTNHIHLLIQVSDIPLGAFMQRIGSRYARAVHARVPTTGHLFQNRYHSLLVDVDRYFATLLRYIHLNPVRAGLVRDPVDYRWSSHRAYLGTDGEAWLTTGFGLGLFSSDADRARERYRAFVMEDLGAQADRHLTKPARGEPRVLGGVEFRRRVGQPVGARSASRSLDEIIDDVCSEFGISADELVSSSQARRLTRARGEATARALGAGAGSLSDIARRLGRSASALSRAAGRRR